MQNAQTAPKLITSNMHTPQGTVLCHFVSSGRLRAVWSSRAQRPRAPVSYGGIRISTRSRFYLGRSRLISMVVARSREIGSRPRIDPSLILRYGSARTLRSRCPHSPEASRTDEMAENGALRRVGPPRDFDRCAPKFDHPTPCAYRDRSLPFGRFGTIPGCVGI